MSTYPTNPALEAAIIAHADEDTPRLAYADWLDENGDPDRAEMIRTQIRIADMPPSHPDWITLNEQQEELNARLQHRSDLTRGNSDVKHIYCSGLGFTASGEAYRRGFPYSASCQVDGDKWTPEECDRIAREWERLARTTTLRGFGAYHWTGPSIDKFLSSPGAAYLDALSVSPDFDTRGPWQQVRQAVTLRVAYSNELRHLRRLDLNADLPPIAVAELARNESFESLRRFKFGEPLATAREVERLTNLSWFRRLREVTCEPGLQDAAVPVVRGLGELADLHTLTFYVINSRRVLADDAYPALAAGAFPALAYLNLQVRIDGERAQHLATARFPSLVAFEAYRCATGDAGLTRLLRADWFARLQLIDITDSWIRSRGVKAIASHPVAKNLRVLRLPDNPLGQGALDALVEGEFPQLTTLSLAAENKPKRSKANLAKFLAKLNIPTLKHLDLSGWSLGDAGAKALAANPSLGNLTCLHLDRCKIGDAGIKAILASPYLQNLLRLDINTNLITPKGLKSLADPAVLPRLGMCLLEGLPYDIEEQFKRPKLYVCP